MTTQEADTCTLCLPLPSDGLVGDSDAAAGPGLLSDGVRSSGEAPAYIMHAAAEKSIFLKGDSTARGMTRCCLGCFLRRIVVAFWFPAGVSHALPCFAGSHGIGGVKVTHKWVIALAVVGSLAAAATAAVLVILYSHVRFRRRVCQVHNRFQVFPLPSS